MYDVSTRSSSSAQGTHVWLRVIRDSCTSTLRGMGGLPVHESFSLYGKPVLSSLEAELSARSAEGSSADRVEGLAYFGTSADREYVVAGRFSLIRTLSEPETEDG